MEVNRAAVQQVPDLEAGAEVNDSDDDEQFIQVDNEAQVLQDERMLEGEEIEVVDPHHHQPLPQPQARPSSVGKANPGEWQIVQMSEGRWKKMVEKGFHYRPMKAYKARQIEDIRTLTEKDRWQLYHHWVSEHLKLRKRQIAAFAWDYNARCEEYTDAQEALNVHVLGQADVIGMTTTGAAKHSYILHEIYPKILIIEEAAEVFESHIVTSLSPSVQQLILIGDHKQLRPKPNHYELERKYGLAVSLFERLVTGNQMKHTTLEVQHRMRPEIASLVRPHIYSHLLDHESVLNRENVAGIGKNLFFIDHTYPEVSNPDGDLRSHANIHEVEFLIALCRYLLKQGYSPTQITILTMYQGQLLEFRKRMKRHEFEGVRVAAVDDFQGEENDIILLSLVRSNSDNSIGFLRIENRVCVSLSRAKQGLYVIGNLKMLRNEVNTVWPNILMDLDQKHYTGQALPLQCQVHPDQVVQAKTAEDFSKCPEGGCQQRCERRLECGHVCRRFCHPYDRDHKIQKCHQQCMKTLPCGHPCTRKCYECKDGCRPCSTIVTKVNPHCNHEVKLACHKDVRTVKCMRQCSRQLRCGHLCQESCSQLCTSQCKVMVEKTLPCGDKVKAFCHQPAENIECQKPCDKHLDCEHLCSGTCGRCHRGRLHVQCAQKCNQDLICGHICDFPCTPNCPPCVKPCKNYCNHSRCPRKCFEPCDPCMEPCLWNCEHFTCTKRCGEMCDRPACNEACPKVLKCGHPCIGLCGEDCPSICHVCDEPGEEREIFFGFEEDDDAKFIQLKDCGHVFEVQGLDMWMEKEEEKPNEVKLKVCPKCKVPLRKSLRYGNIIKKTLQDYEEIKQKQVAVTRVLDSVRIKLIKVEKEIVDAPHDVKQVVTADFEKIKGTVLPQLERTDTRHSLLPHSLHLASTQLTALSHIVTVLSILSPIAKSSSFNFLQATIRVADVRRDAQVLLRFVMRESVSLSDQQVGDMQCELRRLMCVARLCDLQFKLESNKCKTSPMDQSQLNRLACQVFHSGLDNNLKMTREVEQQVTDLITHFSKQYSVNGLSDVEHVEVVKAMGLNRRHWFKCPNGHFYFISDCGGATMVAKCPECGAEIGGTNRRLPDSNRWAPEMDGTRHLAWSDAANMASYHFDD